MKQFTSVGCIAFLFICAQLVQAGKIIKLTQKELNTGKVEYITIFLDKNEVRFDSEGADQNIAVIYSATDNRYVIINHSKKAYVILTRENVERMANKMKNTMNQMMQQMQEQLKNLPPEQRKMFEEMMKNKMPQQPVKTQSTPEVKKEYRKLKSGVRVGAWTTTHYEVYHEGQKEEEWWTVPLGKLGLGESDFAVIEKMESFFQSMIPPGEQEAASLDMFSSKEFMSYGIPVKEVAYNQGKPVSESVIQSVESRMLTPSLFKPPVGYKKVSDLMQLMMQ